MGEVLRLAADADVGAQAAALLRVGVEGLAVDPDLITRALRQDLHPVPFARRLFGIQQLADAAPIWTEIARRRGLSEPDLGRLASAWHTDADLGRPIECVTDMSKSRKLGFLDYQETDDSFFDLFTQLRARRSIP